MKIRNGFVSNSSSSSFLIIGKQIDIKDVSLNLIKKKDIYALGSGYLNGGQDVFKIRNVEQLAFLKALYDVGDTSTFFVWDTCYFGIDESGDIDKSKLPDGKVEFYSGMVDHHSSHDIEDLKSRYDNGGDITRFMQKYLRSKKINEIEKKNKKI